MTRPTGRPVRAAFLADHPAHYFAPAFRALARRPELVVRVFYRVARTDNLFDPGFGAPIAWHTDLHSGYDWWAAPTSRHGAAQIAAIARALRRYRPEVLLSHGWAGPVARTGMLYALATGTPLLFVGDTNSRDVLLRAQAGRLRSRLLRLLLRTATGVLATSEANHRYYLDSGVPPQRIHHGVLPADLPPFLAAATDRDAAASRGVRGRVVLGYVGKLVPVKAVEDLIQACALLPGELPWELWLVGDGPLRDRLVALVTERGLAGRVRFLGFRNTDELPALMARMDVCVLPSHREARGLVVVEAMAAGAATVVSSATGVWGRDDALIPGRTGLVYPVGEVGALVACLRRLIEDPDLRRRLAKAGQERADRYGPEAFARTTAAALVATTAGRRR